MSHPSSATRPAETLTETRRRIIAAGTTLFDTRGFAHASLEEVCSETGIDCDTVKRHFPTIYDLFRECMLESARGMLAATEIGVSVPSDSRQARALLVSTLESLAAAHVARRTRAGFVRGDYRYLNADDQRELHEIQTTVHERIAALLQRVRPTLDSSDIELLSIAAASTITTAGSAPTVLPDQKLRTILTVSAMRLLESHSALTATTGEFAPRHTPPWMGDNSKASRVIAATIDLVYRKGFSAVTLKDIAHETGFPLWAIRRKVSNTADLLSAAFATGSAAMGDAIGSAVRAAGPLPRDILLTLSHKFVEHFFSDPKLLTIFILDAHHLPVQYAERADELHEKFMSPWLLNLKAIRPELADAEARFLVYAALNIVEDVGSHLDWQYDYETMAKIERLVVATLIGGR
ncbi:TetR/AcrR family transcriptional regulator [Salinibacterium sp. SYSU T00001]|uniref:TetR/AcrR family transcriptional regulator n=1 Tax=Homoserinimonas sedimenticola TaxID=2986805 RepID=UPI002235B008|nr:TetR/AcrR family transcriptional regulator [Salinibacterium sedimenticola]MCW4384175.1 TetR/AcrR family transcriptional regulator [Salinibacterium sedimenticola]